MSDVFQLNESGRVGYFRWTHNGAIYAPSPAPTALLYALDGTSGSIALTQQGTGVDTRYYADLSEAGAGLYEIVASTTDTAADCAAFQAEVRIGQDWIQTLNGLVQAIWDKATSALTTSGSIGKYIVDNLVVGGIAGIPAAVWNYAVSSWGAVTTAGGFIQSLLNTINAKLTNTPISIVTPFDNTNTLRLVQYQTYSAADNTQIQISVSVPTDPTESAVKFAFNFGAAGSVSLFDGTVVSYDSGTGIAVFGLELTAAQTGALQTGQAFNFSLGVVLTSSAGNLIPISYYSGHLQVFAANNPAA